MTEQELVKLEIERRALLETANEMSAGDRCMDTKIQDMVDRLRAKAAEIQKTIDREVGK